MDTATFILTAVPTAIDLTPLPLDGAQHSQDSPVRKMHEWNSVSLLYFFFLFSDLSTDNLRFLSSRQALADLAHFRTTIAEARGLTNAKWVAFGGSYPGSLAAWFRLKYPHMVHAAVASSAPVRATVNFPGMKTVNIYTSLIFKPWEHLLHFIKHICTSLSGCRETRWIFPRPSNYSLDLHRCHFQKIQKLITIVFVRSGPMQKYGGGTFFAPADSDPHHNLNKNLTFITSARLHFCFSWFLAK